MFPELPGSVWCDIHLGKLSVVTIADIPSVPSLLAFPSHTLLHVQVPRILGQSVVFSVFSLLTFHLWKWLLRYPVAQRFLPLLCAVHQHDHQRHSPFVLVFLLEITSISPGSV